MSSIIIDNDEYELAQDTNFYRHKPTGYLYHIQSQSFYYWNGQDYVPFTQNNESKDSSVLKLVVLESSVY